MQFEIILKSWAVKHGINDKSLKELLGMMKLAADKQAIPDKITIDPYIRIKKQYIICDSCDNVKLSEICDSCQKKTIGNHFLLLNTKEQVEKILSFEENMHSIINNRDNLSILGYHEGSLINKIHGAESNACTLTFNTDGMQVFRKSIMDAWPIFLTINELPAHKKYAKENIILPGIWMGKRKLSNLVVLNEMCQSIAQMERGISVKSRTIKVFCIYGSFDKPARSTILNRQSSNAEYGCCFCVEKSKRHGKKLYYNLLHSNQYMDHSLIMSRMIKSTERNEPFKGLKGFSPIR